MSNKIRVLLVDDHAILRAGLTMLLNGQADMEVVGEASDGLGAVRECQALRPDVAVIDITMPGMNGTEAVRQIRKKNLGVRCLILTMHESEDFLFQALQAGSAGYVLKKAAHTDLIEAIRMVYRGEPFLYPSAVKSLLGDYLGRVNGGRERDSYRGLTERQREVLLLVARGYTNQEIATRLVLSVKTVEKHKAELMARLGLDSRSGLVSYALRNGLLAPEP